MTMRRNICLTFSKNGFHFHFQVICRLFSIGNLNFFNLARLNQFYDAWIHVIWENSCFRNNLLPDESCHEYVETMEHSGVAGC